MAIRIERNEAGNCINFHGASNPTYWNACLSGEVDSSDANTVNVINDIITAQTGITEYEYFRVPFTEFVDAEGNNFADAQTAANYITEKANVIGLSGEGISLVDETVCFSLDATSTSIMLDNGYSFGVNTIKAVEVAGLINIVSNDGADDITHFYELDPLNTCVNGNPVSGGLNDVINTLNELFTVGAFESIVIADPYSTMVADVSGVDTSVTYVGNGIDPVGDDVYGSTSSNSQNGFKTVETIDQAGEYFTFDIRVEGTIGFGLIHTQASYDDGYWSGYQPYADPTSFGVGNNAHYGFQFSHWFHPTPNGSWTNYGANTSYSMRAGWSNFNGTDEQADWLAGNPIKVRVGLDTNGYISIETLRNGTDWVVHSRTSYPIVDGAEFHLGIKTNHTGARVYTLPKVHLLEPAAPTMYFRYIESPDNNYHYPLFATEEEANYFDLQNGGTGTSTTNVYPDEPTFTQWYEPTNGHIHNGTSAPTSAMLFEGNPINWTEITSQTNADLAPSAFADTTITVDELSAVNYQLSPVDVGYTTSIGGIPAWSLVDGTTLQGTAPEVTGDNVANPSDTTTVTVYRTNSYGTSQGTLTIVINNLTAPVVTPITGFTHNASSTALIDSDTMDDGSIVSMDEQLLDLERLVILKSFVESNVLPSLSQSGDKYIIGALNSGADVSSLEVADYDVAIVWEYETSSSHTFKFYKDGGLQQNIVINSMTQAFYDYAIELNNGSAWLIACNANAINTEPSPEYGGTFSNATEFTLGETAPLTISFGYSGGSSADFDTTGLSEIVTPAPSDWIQVIGNPSHVLNFDGSTTMPTLQAGYTYRFLMGDTAYADLTTSTGLHVDDDLRFTADGTTEYTTGITRVGNPNDLGTFGAHTAYVEFVVPSDVPPLQWYTDHNGIGSTNGTTISGSTYVEPITGVTIEGLAANFTGNVINSGSQGWISLNEQLSTGERLVLDSAFIEDLCDAMPDYSIAWFGLKGDSWSNTSTPTSSFKGLTALRFYKTSSAIGEAGIRVLGYANGSLTAQFYSLDTTDLSAFLEITSSGNNVRVGVNSGSYSDNPSTTTYADWNGNLKVQTGDQGYGISSLDVAIYWQGISGNTVGFDISDVDWTGLNEINIPTPAVTNLTPWTKALDFSGSAEHAKQVNSANSTNAIRMNGVSNTAALNVTPNYTSSSTNARPWATAIVFRADGNNSNQHIWNQGEGAGSTDDNIYLRMDSNGQLYFGWGRQGALNECALGSTTTGRWYGIYIAHNGTRLSGSNATAANLAAAFDIRITTEIGNWTGATYNYSKSFTWSNTGGRMDRQISGDFTIGGRGSNRNFHGKVASMVVTTLRRNQPMPTTAEIEMMITDPVKWLEDYKVGNLFRYAFSTSEAIFDAAGSRNYTEYYSTQVWLMGDGSLDNYSNGIRNVVYPTDQNITKMQLNSMVSNDIENVNINGLS